MDGIGPMGGATHFAKMDVVSIKSTSPLLFYHTMRQVL